MHPFACHTPINVRAKSLPPRFVWNAWVACPEQSQTVTRYPSRTSSVRPLVRSTQIAHTGRFNGKLRAL
jgi:hypothetical protein